MEPCCSMWDQNPLLATKGQVHARLDGFPVTPGHALVIPRRHVVSFVELSYTELIDVHWLVKTICEGSDAESFTIGINDGVDAGRTVDHLHVHVIPRRPGDVLDPRGGIRRIIIPAVENDPWIGRNI